MSKYLPKYCQPNPIKRMLLQLSEVRCLKCQYINGPGCKLRYEKGKGYWLDVPDIDAGNKEGA